MYVSERQMKVADRRSETGVEDEGDGGILSDTDSKSVHIVARAV